MGMISKKAGGISALGIALGAAMIMAPPASAAPVSAVFNFDVLGDTGDSDWNDFANGAIDGGNFNSTTNIYTKNDIGVQASASALNDGDAQAYLDDDLSGRLAGLGVCSKTNVTGASCAGDSDDNVGEAQGVSGNDETLKLSFTYLGEVAKVSLTDLRFKDSEHDNYSGTVIIGNGNGSGPVTATVASGSLNGTSLTAIAGLGSASMWTFMYDGDSPVDTSTSRNPIAGYFYLAGATATVPLPAGVLLLGSALGGLGLMKRRRKAA